MVVWVLSSALLQNAYWDFYKAVWDGEGWGADGECFIKEKNEKFLYVFLREGILCCFLYIRHNIT